MTIDPEEFNRGIGELVEKTLQGDPQATAALYKLYEKKMIQVTHYRLGHTLHGLMESVDLVQSVWKDALDNLNRFDYQGPDSFYRWLHTCLINKIEGKRRYHRAEKRDAHKLSRLQENGISAAAPAVGKQDPTPSQAAMGGEAQTRFMEILNGFPETQRRVLVLRMRDEKDFEAIAKMIGKSREATKKIYQRGLKKLIDRLPEQWRTEP